MIATGLLPRTWRRTLIDKVYGAEDNRGLRIYLGALWGALLLAALILTGFTPWAWPAQREAQVASLAQVTCEEVRTRASDDDADPPRTNTSRSRSKATGASSRATACRQALGPAELSQLGRVESLVAYLQRGGAAPPPLGLESDSRLRAWVDSRVCRLRGADGGERGALAWHVWQGAGECGGGDRLVAQFPLTILLGPLLGMVLTPALLLWLAFQLGRHSLRLPATRRAYRRLYGSEHKAP